MKKMEKKTIFSMIFSILILVGLANATSYEYLDFSFSDVQPSDVQILTYICQDTSCSSAIPASASYYSGDAITCWNTYAPAGDIPGFNTCMETYKISSNVIPANSKVFVEYNDLPTFGYNNYLFTSGDSYLPNYAKRTGITCPIDNICMETSAVTISFSKKDYAVAEIQQLNIKNIDNELLPIQIEIPVTIKETVCSAFRFSNPNMFKPTPPLGYSDYSANTQINLAITKQSDGSSLLEQIITIPIEADTCAGLAAFSWTPDNTLENEAVKFRVETEVIDNQVITGGVDWSEVIETIYPSTLDNACWTRAYDFTLANIPTTDITTSIAQISEGESLYIAFNAGAWRDNTITSMDFTVKILFDGVQIYQDTLTTLGNDIEFYSLDISSNIASLPSGFYNVTLITEPLGTGCAISSPVTQTQNLEILAPEMFSIIFHVKDLNYNTLNNALVNLELLSVDDYYQTTPTYSMNGLTSGGGLITFTNIIGGNYSYNINLDGFATINDEVHIASNINLYITMQENNTAPIINLPNEITEYYMNPIDIDMRDYASDFNDLFNDLIFNYEITSGSGSVTYNAGIYTIITSTPNTVVLKITVTDTQGVISSDSINLNFIDNQAPIISQFLASPDNGDASLNTNFDLIVSDSDGDNLTCIIEFGDGASTTDDCLNLNGVGHLYENVGTYNVRLSVDDGVNELIYAYEQVFVFERKYSSPHIDSFTLVSSNGNYIPTDLTLSWSVTHPDATAMTCTLRINGISTVVDCIDNNYLIDNFTTIGNSKFTLIADDGTNQVLRTIDRTFTQVGPDIVFFIMGTSNNFLLPNNLTFSWDTNHNANLPMTCNLEIDGINNSVACSSKYIETDFNINGTSVFRLHVTDGIMTTSSTISQLFVQPGTVNLTTTDVKLVIDSVIVPGEFNFAIETKNETLADRQLFVQPVIRCNGVDNKLDTVGGLISTSAESSVNNDIFRFDLKVNTRDFKLGVPIDVNCIFNVILTDAYGTNLQLTESVMFSYPVENMTFTSIRGKGTDVIDFMTATFGDSVSIGYNSVQFNVANNEDFSKDMSISMISQNLGIEYKTEFNLGIGQERRVSIPLYVDENTKPGAYPVRYAVSDGTDKQVRYSYIFIN